MHVLSGLSGKMCGGVVLVPVVAILILGAGRVTASDPDQQPVGLSLFFQNGQMPAFTLVGTAPRYLSEIDIVATTAPSPVDAEIEPLIANSEFSVLDWTGVHMVEEN